MCNICLTTMVHARHVREHSQLGTSSLLRRGVARALHAAVHKAADDTFRCPQCKTEHDANSVEECDAGGPVTSAGRLLPEGEYAPPDDADDDNYATRRHTRSQGAPVELKRRTRSSGVYM